MPLFEFKCIDCGKIFELLITGSDEKPQCQSCSSQNLKKLFSPHSSFSGKAAGGLPGPGDTGCCGAHPNHASCAGPGSCCGKIPA